MTGPQTRRPRVDNPDAMRDEWLRHLGETPPGHKIVKSARPSLEFVSAF
jgi:hypothetical protein